jgi:hypothetical protein
MYVLALEAEGFQFLFDPGELYKPPIVHVRKGVRQAELWLEDDVSLRRAGGFIEPDADRIVELVETYQDQLLDSWYSVREDHKRGRLHKRNTMID